MQKEIKKDAIQLSDHFTFHRLLRFTFPTIIMTVFASLYSIVDGFFVSNFAGKTEFAAVNFIMPLLMILGCVGIMFGTGGGALVAKTIGEGNDKRANELFSFTVAMAFVSGVVLALIGFALIRPVALLMGADEALLASSTSYARVCLIGIPFYMLQYAFYGFFSAAEKPKLGLCVTIAAGVTNMVLDFFFVAVFSWGVVGAAAATVLSEVVGGGVPLVYFARKNTSRLRLGNFNFDKRALTKICSNGSSELVSNISMSFVSMLYNAQLIRYAGENGVATYGVLMYVGMVFQAIFFGYSLGSAPIVSFNYGARNKGELQNMFKKSFALIGIFSVSMFTCGQIFSGAISSVFVGYDAALLDMTVGAFRIFSFAFLFSGFAIFGSSFFTALNNGLVSAAISFLRTLVFQCAAVISFPLLWGIDGIWISLAAAELMADIITFSFIAAGRKKYNYY